MSADPGALIVRDAKTGQPVSISTKFFPEWVKPPLWFNNVQWQYSHMLDKEEVIAYLDDRLKKGPKITRDLARRIALYIECYAKHIVMMGYLFSPSEEREGYAGSQREFIVRLTELRRSVESSDDVSEMMSLCMDYGIDPL